MKNILVLMHDDAGQEARLQAALDVTRAVSGHLKCLDVVVYPAFAGFDGAAEGVAILLGEEQEREATNRAKLEARLANEDVAWDYSTTAGDLSRCLTEASRLADLVVVNRKLDDLPYPDMLQVAGDILLNAHKPVLAVPAACKGIDVTGPALVAWNGSMRAMAALTAAVPLLALSGDVTIVQIGEEGVEAPAAEAATYLSRHGIRAGVRDVRGSGSVADALLNEIMSDKPAYAVMGGYGHSRLAEALIGGVTRKMLNESPVPLFLAH